MRKKIKEVMRYSGTRMLLYHPIIVIRHGIESYKERRYKRERGYINDK